MSQIVPFFDVFLTRRQIGELTLSERMEIQYAQHHKLAEDAQCATRLLAGLTDLATRPSDSDLLEGLLLACHQAISAVWSQDAQPTIGIVLGERFCRDKYANLYRWASHLGPGDYFVADKRIADPDECLARAFSVQAPVLSARDIHVFFNPGAPRSQIRWRDPVGDRTIVVLPPQYEGPKRA